MPNKTIYVADNDLAVFDRAQELAGENLSATIAQALRRFIETEEARTQGFGEITLKVGKPMTYTYKQFLGRELARHRYRDPESGRVFAQTVFQTAKGRLVLSTRARPDWSDFGAWSDWSDWASSLDFNFDWDKDWNLHWSWGPEQRAGEGATSEERAQARRQAQEEAKARRDEWRQRRREEREARRAARGRGDWPDWSDGGDYDMEVYETLDDLKPHISEEFFAQVVRALRGDDVEFLDI